MRRGLGNSEVAMLPWYRRVFWALELPFILVRNATIPPVEADSWSQAQAAVSFVLAVVAGVAIAVVVVVAASDVSWLVSVPRVIFWSSSQIPDLGGFCIAGSIVPLLCCVSISLVFSQFCFSLRVPQLLLLPPSNATPHNPFTGRLFFIFPPPCLLCVFPHRSTCI